MARHPKRPRDPNQLAHLVMGLATKEKTDDSLSVFNVHAVELGRLGGLKGGNARAKKLSKSKRSEIAKKAALARWAKKKG